jgi:hypothetical protein
VGEGDAVVSLARIVHLHVDNNSGFFYGDQSAPEKVSRRARTVDRASWWAERLKILRRWTLPNLALARKAGFAPLFFFRYEDEPKAAATIKAVADAGYTAIFGGVEGMLQWMRGTVPKIDGLHAVRLDTDDMVSAEGWKTYRELKFLPGLAAQFEIGYAYGYDDGRLAAYDAHLVPPTFFSTMYPRAALSDVKAFQDFRDAAGFNVPHYKLRYAKKWISLPKYNFVQGIHSVGTSGSWTNRHTLSKCVRWIKDRVKIRKTLARFGVEPVA